MPPLENFWRKKKEREKGERGREGRKREKEKKRKREKEKKRRRRRKKIHCNYASLKELISKAQLYDLRTGEGGQYFFLQRANGMILFLQKT